LHRWQFISIVSLYLMQIFSKLGKVVQMNLKFFLLMKQSSVQHIEM
jgi:hypothetical protein